MPALNWYLNNSPATGAHKLLATSSSGAAATTTTGWVVAKNGASTYARMDCGVERSGAFTGTAQPSGAPDTAAPWDCFRLDNGAGAALSGIFVTGAWVFNLPVRSVTAVAATGRCRFRLWKSANTDGSSATEITSGTQIGSTVTLSTSATQTSTVTTGSITGFTLTNEYLFLQIAWENVTAGSSNSSDVDIRSSEGTAFCTSPSFGALQSVTNGTISSGSTVSAPAVYRSTVATVAGSGVGSGTSSSSQSVDLTVAGAASTGDLLIVAFGTRTNAATFPAGWSALRGNVSWDNAGGRIAVYSRLVYPGDPTSISITVGGTGTLAHSWAVFRITGHKFSSESGDHPIGSNGQVDDSGVGGGATFDSLNPSTWATDATLWIAVGWTNSTGNTFTAAPAGWSNYASGTANLPIAHARKSDGVASEPSASFTSGGTGRSVGIQFAIAPDNADTYTGIQDVWVGTVASGSTLYAATVAGTVPSQAVTGAFISSGSALSAPTVAYAVTNGTIATGSALFAATVAYAVTGAAISSASSLAAPTVAYAVTNGTVAATTTLAAPTVAPGAVTVTGAFISSGSSLLAPIVAYAVAGATLAAASALYAPTTTYLVTGATVAAGSALYAPTATQIATGAFISSTTVLRTPTVLAEQAVTAAAVSSTLTLAAPSTAYALTAAAISSTVTLSSPTVSPDQTVTNGTVTSTLILYATTVLADQAITVATIAASSTLSAPAVEPPIQTVTTAGISATTTVAAPSVAYAATGATIASTSTTAAPSISYAVTVSSIAASSSLYAPSAATLTFITVGTVTAASSLYEPLVQLASGPQTVLAAYLASTTTLSAPTVVPPSASVTTATIAAASTTSAPTVTTTYALTAGTIAASTTLSAPTVSPGAITVTAASIASTTSIYATSVAYALTAGTIASGVILSTPDVAPGAATVTAAHLSTSAILFAPSVFTAEEITLAHIPSAATARAPRKVYHVRRRVVVGLLANDTSSAHIVTGSTTPNSPLTATSSSLHNSSLTATSTRGFDLTAKFDE